MELFNKTGKMALGSRLRLFASTITEDAEKIYDLYNVDMVPKWFPVFYTLSDGAQKTITEIAVEIGHSQPSVSKIIREMTTAGLVEENRESQDKRRNFVALTEKGKLLIEKIEPQYIDMDAAMEGILLEARHNLWEALEEWEFLLNQKNLLVRIREEKKKRESKDVEIVPYKDEYQSVFKALNEEWISTYFEMEEADYKALDHPKEYILNQGGQIFIALYKNQPVGVCALVKSKNPKYDFELSKMAVSPLAQGKNIGFLLGQAVINAAKNMGASSIFLESNTILKPAINMYHKLGFEKTAGESTYKRCNIHMELNFK